jgi:hypothetical protein
MANRNIRKRDIQAAIWLLGLGILFLTDWFWPGILILIGLSILVNTLYKAELTAEIPPGDTENHAESAKPEDAFQVKASEPAPPPPAQEAGAPPAWHDSSILPSRCPRCGAPVQENQVRWTGPKSAICPYCNDRLV